MTTPATTPFHSVNDDILMMVASLEQRGLNNPVSADLLASGLDAGRREDALANFALVLIHIMEGELNMDRSAIYADVRASLVHSIGAASTAG